MTKHTVFPTLYKRRSDKGIQEWTIEVRDDSFRTITGIYPDGQKVTSAWTQCLGKNIGKSNETSPDEQALLEAEAEQTKKLAQGGYHDKLEDIDSPKFFKPMLAKTYGEDYTPTQKEYNVGAVCSQPKLDGVRCIATADGLWSRQGKPLISTPHILQSLAPLFNANPDLILDGELYCDRLSSDFDKIISLVRQSKPSMSDIIESQKYIQYWVYDLPSVNHHFILRRAALSGLLASCQIDSNIIKEVPTQICQKPEDLDYCYNEYMQQGFEGQMVRISNKEYENKRSKQLLKRKEFKDQEFTVVDIQEGIGNRAGMAGMIIYDLGDGRTFGSGIQGNFKYYKEILEQKDKYIGGQGTVRYQNLTPDGIPRFPVTTVLYGGKRDI